MRDRATDGPPVGDLDVGDAIARLGDGGDGRRRLPLGIGVQGPDRDAAVRRGPVALELAAPAEVDQLVGTRQAELEEPQEALATGQDLGITTGDRLDRLVEARWTLILERRRDHAWPPFAPWIARHTVWAVYGMSRWRMPSGLSASTT